MTTSTTLESGRTLSAIDPALGSPAAELPSRISATVPGTAYTDLLAAGLIEDPYVDLREFDDAWIGHTRWSYRLKLRFASIGARRA